MPDDDRQPDLQRGIAALLMQHRRGLYSYIYACVRDRHLAEDLVQEVAQIALESISTLREPEKFAPWLFGIARRRILMHARKTWRQQVLPPDVIDIMATAAAELPSHVFVERRDALSECLDELPPRSRQIILRRYADSRENIDTLAAELGRTVQAVYGVLKRIRLKLLDCVERKLAGADR